MCCRDGAEKPPKPPKPPRSTLAPTKYSIKRTAEVKSNVSRAYPPKGLKPAVNKANRQVDPSGVEVINLAGNPKMEANRESESQGYKKLHKLHESIVGSTPARIIKPKHPSLSFIKSRQPQTSSLSKAPHIRDSSHNISSDDSDDFIEDFPSPSTLVQADTAVIDAENVSSTFDEGLSDLEAGMIDLDNSLRQQDKPQKPPAEKSLPKNEGPSGLSRFDEDFQEDLSDVLLCQNDITRASSLRVENLDDPFIASEDNRLFLKTSTPEKQYNGRDELFDTEGAPIVSKKHMRDPSWEDAPVATKQKLSIPEPYQPTKSSGDGNAQTPKIQPFRNMEGIDLDYLLAEYGDFIEFVDE